MNYEALQMLIKSLTANFKCTCGSFVDNKDINLLAIVGGKLVDIEINCPKCKNKSFIRSKTFCMELSKMNLSNEQMAMIKNMANVSQKAVSVNDNFISDLDKNLKKECVNVGDLFER